MAARQSHSTIASSRRKWPDSPPKPELGGRKFAASARCVACSLRGCQSEAEAPLILGQRRLMIAQGLGMSPPGSSRGPTDPNSPRP